MRRYLSDYVPDPLTWVGLFEPQKACLESDNNSDLWTNLINPFCSLIRPEAYS